MFKVRTLSRLVILVLSAVSATTAVAAESPKPSGKVSIGMGGIALRNQNGVVSICVPLPGAKLQLGPSGMTIKLKK